MYDTSTHVRQKTKRLINTQYYFYWSILFSLISLLFLSDCLHRLYNGLYGGQLAISSEILLSLCSGLIAFVMHLNQTLENERYSKENKIWEGSQVMRKRSS